MMVGAGFSLSPSPAGFGLSSPTATSSPTEEFPQDQSCIPNFPVRNWQNLDTAPWGAWAWNSAGSRGAEPGSGQDPPGHPCALFLLEFPIPTL